MTSENRAWQIRDWGFQCTCHLCTSKDDDELSDGYRNRLAHLRTQLRDNHTDLSLQQLVGLAAEMLTLVEIEGLIPHLGDHCEDLSEAFAAKGDLESAVRYHRMALDAWLLYGGEDHVHVSNVERRLKELESLRIERARGFVSV